MRRTSPPTAHEYAAWVLAALGMLFVLLFHLLPALIAGLLIYELVHAIFPLFARRLSNRCAKGVAVGLVVFVVVAAIGAGVFGVVAFVKSEGGSLSALLGKMADVVETSRAHLPTWIADYLPRTTDSLREAMSQWLREHAAELQRIGKETGQTLARLVIGMVIGAMVSMREWAFDDDTGGPLAHALVERFRRLAEAFRRIVFAQVRISAINTTFTAIYLAVVLPSFGVSLPLVKTMIAVTFVVGLLPVVGNLISNTVVVTVSLAQSPAAALSSLAFLVIIHKLEYFLNARIVGGQIRAKAWELLTAMLVMESALGIPGLVAAPFCYAWLKDELMQRRLI